MDNYNTKNYKRTTRTVDAHTRAKIAQALKGHSHSEETKEKISQGLIRYWQQIPTGSDSNNNTSGTSEMGS